jgi:hypothetical protein
VILALLAFAGLAFIPFRSLLFLGTNEGPRQKLEDPVEVLTVAELFADPQEKGAQDRERYVGKVIRVTGSVARVGKSPSGAPLVDLVHIKQSQVFTVRCEFGDSNSAARVRQGDLVSIDGRCRGGSTLVLLEDCGLCPPGEKDQ